MIKSKKKSLGNFFRGFLFCWFLLATTLGSLWIICPEQINWVDEWILDNYTQGATNRLADCNEKIKRGNKSAKDCLETLLNNDFHTIKKEDRLALLKRKALMSAVSYYRDEKNLDKIEHWFKTWIDFDDRDLTAKVSKAQVYFAFPKKRQEALRILSELNAKYPDVKMVVNAYEESLVYSKRFSTQ